MSRQYRALGPGDEYRRITYVLDPSLRVLDAVAFSSDGDAHATALFALLDRLPRLPPAYPAVAQAPVLVLQQVYEPELCEALVQYYRAHGGAESGYMEEVGGITTRTVDHVHKRRRDCTIEDPALQRACRIRVHDRLVPAIQRAFQFVATRMERYIVACYDAAERGHFRAHRDNTTKGTAHRRFAVSLFLNPGEYEGGFLRFPEYGPALYTASRGGAVVFSCSLLHEATVVTRGRRYMFLPFLYDEAARKIREQNLPFLDVAASESVTREPQPAARVEEAPRTAPP